MNFWRFVVERLYIKRERKRKRRTTKRKKKRVDRSPAAQDSPEQTSRRPGEIRSCAMTLQTGRHWIALASGSGLKCSMPPRREKKSRCRGTTASADLAKECSRNHAVPLAGLIVRLHRSSAHDALLLGQIWQKDHRPIYMESGRVQRMQIHDEPDHFTLVPDARPAAPTRKRCTAASEPLLARTAEWLSEEMSDSELSARRKGIPRGRYLDFQLDLTRDFLWEHPLKAGGPQRSTILSFQKLRAETAF